MRESIKDCFRAGMKVTFRKRTAETVAAAWTAGPFRR